MACFCAAGFVGCGGRGAHAPVPQPTAVPEGSFIDLQPGWRLRVITPLFQSGKYVAVNGQEEASGQTITMKAASGFVGYETDYYAVARRGGGGIRVSFSAGEATRDQQTTPKSAPASHILNAARNSRYVRLLYLQRASSKDHNMAVLAAEHLDRMERLTRDVAHDGATCQTQAGQECWWIPLGVAVRPERPDDTAAGRWLPAR